VAFLDLFRLDGQTAIVTGAARGLGRAIALALAGAGADVALVDILPTEETAVEVKKLGRRPHSVVVDLAKLDPNGAAAIVDDVATGLGAPRILINNAGIIRRQPAAEHSDDNWDEVIEVNLTNVFRLSRAAGQHMLRRGRGGKIVNIASMLSFQGGITVPSYAAAKGGLVQLTKALANEWAPHGINVNAIAPGYMETDNTEALRADAARYRTVTERIPVGKWGTPQDLAGAAIFLASRASDYVHGHVLVVDGGWLSR
jgi:2-deoxy-D-gluconate 3-dehydrogenase